MKSESLAFSEATPNIYQKTKKQNSINSTRSLLITFFSQRITRAIKSFRLVATGSLT
jgi:hypothetical protein